MGAWLQEKLPACARRVLERGKAHEKRGHKKGGAIRKGNAQEIERGKARRGAEKWSEKASIKV